MQIQKGKYVANRAKHAYESYVFTKHEGGTITTHVRLVRAARGHLIHGSRHPFLPSTPALSMLEEAIELSPCRE
jgi:hypothetical protein